MFASRTGCVPPCPRVCLDHTRLLRLESRQRTEISTQFTKELAQLFITEDNNHPVEKKESHERQWLEEIYSAMRGPILQTAVANAKLIIADEWQRVNPPWGLSYDEALRVFRLVEEEQQGRVRITDQSVVALGFLLNDEPWCHNRYQPRVPVPRDALGVALTYWSPPRFDQNNPTPYMYHTLRHGDLEGTWADAISSAYELWEGPYSPLGSATWYYNGGTLDAVLAGSLAYDPLRPVRLRITTTKGLVEQLPPEFSGTFVIDCRFVCLTLDSLLALPNTMGLVIPNPNPGMSTQDLFASTARFPALEHLKVCIQALERPLALPIFPTVRAFCCDIFSDRTRSHFAESIADAFPNLEVLHYCSSDGTLVEDLLHFGRLRRLRVLLVNHNGRPAELRHHASILRDSVPGLRIESTGRHRSRWRSSCQVCPYQPLTQRIVELVHKEDQL